ncbi:MAG: TauD/TfdA family dioxygenase, partial [Rhodospirillaceae bacterium]|nr:TauD/TfdA family dioxygenase [Rhodospirillaceae bacterium]
MTLTTDTLTLEIEPLSPVLGASVRGIDLSKPVDDRTAEAMIDAFHKYSFLCFPGQEISADDQLRFANLFGKGDGAVRGAKKQGKTRTGNRGVMYVSNVLENGKPIGVLPDGEMQFHSDGAHRDSPYRATTLYGIKIPSKGGDTLFANLHAAYDALSPSMKDRIAGLKTQFVYDYDAQERNFTDDDDAGLPRAEHDLVRTHPATGRKSLYLSRLMTRRIVDMESAEGEALLLDLFDHAEKPEFV